MIGLALYLLSAVCLLFFSLLAIGFIELVVVGAVILIRPLFRSSLVPYVLVAILALGSWVLIAGAGAAH